MYIYKDNKEENVYYAYDYDDYPDSPRDWDELSTFIGWHRNYRSPDPNDYEGEYMNNFDNEIRFNKDYVCFPVYMYEHGSVALSLGHPEAWMDHWDTGLFGFIYASKEDIRKYYSVKKITKKVMEMVKDKFYHEVDSFAKYMNGYVYVISKYKYEDGILECVDSISGCYDTEEAFREYFGVDIENLEYEDVPNLMCFEHNLRAEEKYRKDYCV